MSNETIGILLVVIIATIIATEIAITLVFSGQCPKCKRFHAMKRTGREEEKEFFENDLYEVQCKYCGHPEWEEETGDEIC